MMLACMNVTCASLVGDPLLLWLWALADGNLAPTQAISFMCSCAHSFEALCTMGRQVRQPRCVEAVGQHQEPLRRRNGGWPPPPPPRTFLLSPSRRAAATPKERTSSQRPFSGSAGGLKRELRPQLAMSYLPNSYLKALGRHGWLRTRVPRHSTSMKELA